MGKITEFFGLCCSNCANNFKRALRTQICPFTSRSCVKMRKSSPEIKIGTCSVLYQNENIIICPNRLLENNRIFIDCFHLLTSHEPGNELYLVPEVKIPGGTVDYFLVSANNRKVRDFVGIELQTLDTTGTVWPERQRFLFERGLIRNRKVLDDSRSFGMNWKMTLKTILIQMHHKTETFEKLNKHLVLVIQTPLYRHMQDAFDFSEIEGVRLGDPVHFHSYEFVESNAKMCLNLDFRVSTDSAGIAKCLGLNVARKIDLEDIIAILEKKLTDENRLVVGL